MCSESFGFFPNTTTWLQKKNDTNLKIPYIYKEKKSFSATNIFGHNYVVSWGTYYPMMFPKIAMNEVFWIPKVGIGARMSITNSR